MDNALPNGGDPNVVVFMENQYCSRAQRLRHHAGKSEKIRGLVSSRMRFVNLSDSHKSRWESLPRH